MSDGGTEKSVDRLLTVEETTERLRVRKGWVYQHVYAGTLPFEYVKIGRYVRVKESSLKAFIERSTMPPARQGND